MAEQERAKTGAGALKTQEGRSQGRLGTAEEGAAKDGWERQREEKSRTAGNGRERGAAKDGR